MILRITWGFKPRLGNQLEMTMALYRRKRRDPFLEKMEWWIYRVLIIGFIILFGLEKLIPGSAAWLLT